MTRERATSIGLVAVALWSIFALMIVVTAPTPPLLLTAMTFAIAGAAGIGWTAARGRLPPLRRVPLGVYALGILGLFGYHVLYFTALRLAPPAEAMLVNYVWPLLIVLGSALLPGERLRAGHVTGGLLAFGGAALVVLRGGAGFDGAALPGYALSLMAATIWAGYSLASRRLAEIPTDVIGVFCLGTAVLSLILHLMLEEAAFPASSMSWVSVVLLGLGPVGSAYYAWDVGMKRGNVQLLGVMSYVSPLISTLTLIAAGFTRPSLSILGAAALITGGAALAARASRAR